MATLEAVRERLTEVRVLGSPKNIVEQGLVRRVELDGDRVTIALASGTLDSRKTRVLREDVCRVVGSLPGVSSVTVEVEDPSGAHPATVSTLEGVRHIVAISSVKGGVGKSTVAAHLALTLQRCGARVGILDLDVYGPSLPILLRTTARPEMTDTQRLEPVEHMGLQLMSVGFFVDEEAPVIWRGPVVMSLVRQFLRDVAWRDLDVLLIDLPPGTGDAPLSLLQLVPIAGGIIVTTPQQVALRDVERGLAMFAAVSVPVLGIVENMAYYVCPCCGKKEALFSTGGGAALSQTYGVPLLAQIPLSPSLQEPLAQETSDQRDVEHATVEQALVSVATQLLDALERREPSALLPRIIN